jgi:hypothetical protein
MQIAPVAAVAIARPHVAPLGAPEAPIRASVQNQDTQWTNPAAAAALRSTVDLLTLIEAGITRNFTDPDRVASFASDLHATVAIFAQATDAVASDASKENDSFLPLITTAGDNVAAAEERLNAKDFNTTWPIYRNDVLAAVRTARSLSQNVADQLDPHSVSTPHR